MRGVTRSVESTRVKVDAMKKLKFLVSLHTMDNDFQIAQASAAEEAAHKLGVDAEITFADNNAVDQSTRLLKAIQNRPEHRPDAIVMEPVSGTALPQVARAASSAGIGWAVSRTCLLGQEAAPLRTLPCRQPMPLRPRLASCSPTSRRHHESVADSRPSSFLMQILFS